MLVSLATNVDLCTRFGHHHQSALMRVILHESWTIDSLGSWMFVPPTRITMVADFTGIFMLSFVKSVASETICSTPPIFRSGSRISVPGVVDRGT